VLERAGRLWGGTDEALVHRDVVDGICKGDVRVQRDSHPVCFQWAFNIKHSMANEHMKYEDLVIVVLSWASCLNLPLGREPADLNG
jgi:hypothetical protein